MVVGKVMSVEGNGVVARLESETPLTGISKAGSMLYEEVEVRTTAARDRERDAHQAELARLRVLAGSLAPAGSAEVAGSLDTPAGSAEAKATALLVEFEGRTWQSALGEASVAGLAELLRALLQSRHALARVRRMLQDGEEGVDDYLAEQLGDDQADAASDDELGAS